MNRKKVIIVVILIALAAPLAAGWVFHKRPNRLSKKYNAEYDMSSSSPCQAVVPECGYCPGEVSEKVCYYNAREE